jgi:hypothetical protein
MLTIVNGLKAQISEHQASSFLEERQWDNCNLCSWRILAKQML